MNDLTTRQQEAIENAYLILSTYGNSEYESLLNGAANQNDYQYICKNIAADVEDLCNTLPEEETETQRTLSSIKLSMYREVDALLQINM
jgi:hypothetical protein